MATQIQTNTSRAVGEEIRSQCQDLVRSMSATADDELYKSILKHNRIHLPIPNAKQMLYMAIKWFAEKEGREAEWLPEYDEIAEYLQNPEGKGLLLFGSPGRGKSLIVARALPMLLQHFHRKNIIPVQATQMGKQLDELLRRRILIIDDVGTEGEHQHFGTKRYPFVELMDECERSGTLLYLTSNLDMSSRSYIDRFGVTKVSDSIEARYGSRTYDRIISNCRVIELRGESLRL